MTRASRRESGAGDEQQHFDVVVVGGGPGGYAAALYGASAGLDVALVEKAALGGTCLHVGCIPAKELLETAAIRRTVRNAAAFGFEGPVPEINWSKALERKQTVIADLAGGLEHLLKGRKVTTFHGHGRLHGGHRVSIADGDSGELAITGDAVIIATGSTPKSVPGFEADGQVVLTSDEFLSIETLPRAAVVLGGGAIGCEFASTLADLGAEVTIIEALPKLLPGCDDDVVRAVEQSFRRRGIEVRTGATVSGHRRREAGATVDYGDDQRIDTDVVVVAVGRRPVTEGLGLDATRVSVDDRGFIVVDDRCRTAEPDVWAVGDCIDTPALAHVAFAEGILAVRDILREDPMPLDHAMAPWAIYCHPEVAFAGFSEAAAKAEGYEVVTSKQRWTGNGRASIIGETEGLMKIVAERAADGSAGRLLGVHVCGPWATEQLGQAHMAVNWEATVGEVAQLVQPHPTLSELFGEAALAMTGRPLHG